jgi:S1-C subfamily serine protease
MAVPARTLPLLLVCLLGGPLAAQDRSRMAEFAALQEAVQQAIDRAEPSIACILVSRSEGYGAFGAAPSGAPGQLGPFHAPGLGFGFAPDPRLRQKVLSLDLSNPDCVPESYGSGVVIDEEKGLVLTQAHVVNKATKVYVRLPGGRGSWADIHASDPRSDLAVLRLLDPPAGLRALRIGDGSKLRKGTFVLALANPYAAGGRDGSPSASWGIVSNVRRRAPGMTSDLQGSDRTRVTIHHFGTLIQTDVRLHPGCSGGALLNLDGELVGLTTAIAALSGAETPGGFAVPMDSGIRRIVDVLRRGEEVEYGFLGVYLPPASYPGAGAKLSDVAPESPAARGGLLPRDVIMSINGIRVHESDDLFLYVGTQLAGNTVQIEVLRGSERLTRSVKLAKYGVAGTPIASNRPRPRAGLRVDYTSVMAQNLGRGIPLGVLVRDVESNSPAERARLQPDTVITRVNGQTVLTPAEFYERMDRSRGPIRLSYLSSNGAEVSVTLDTR